MRSPTLSSSNESTTLVNNKLNDDENDEIEEENEKEEEEEEGQNLEESKIIVNPVASQQITTPKRAKSTFPFGKCKICNDKVRVKFKKRDK